MRSKQLFGRNNLSSAEIFSLDSNISAETRIFRPKPKLWKAKIPKAETISAEIFGRNLTETLFGCPLAVVVECLVQESMEGRGSERHGPHSAADHTQIVEP